MAKTVKIKHQAIELNLPRPEAQYVRSVSGNVKTLAELWQESLALNLVPSGHQLEDDLQFDAYSLLWNLNFRHLCFAWHTPNGGSRDKREAVQLKGQGVRSGVPDLMLMTHGGRMIFVELKVGHHRHDPNQALFARKALDYGFADVYICGTLAELAALLCHIFDVSPSTLTFVS
jgi:hypothetical protein